MKLISAFLSACVCLIILGGCATSAPNAEFTKTVNFSALDTFSYKHTLISGLDFRKSEELLLENLSEETIAHELSARGFTPAKENADFFAVVKWKKAVSNYPGPFDHVDSFGVSSTRRDNPGYAINSRLHLTLEIYERSSGNLFWRNDLPNIFDAVQLTEARIVASLERAIKNFPEHIEKDPNLPNIE